MDTLTTSSDVLEHAVVVVGTIAFAISGTVAAQRRRMDWFGPSPPGPRRPSP
jgi:uncharacterized membrane protein YeiH